MVLPLPGAAGGAERQRQQQGWVLAAALLVPTLWNQENKPWLFLMGQQRSRGRKKPQWGWAARACENGATPRSNCSSAGSCLKRTAGRTGQEQPQDTHLSGHNRGVWPTRAFHAAIELPYQSWDPAPPEVPVLGAEGGLHTGSLPLPAQQPRKDVPIPIPVNHKGEMSQFSQGTQPGNTSYF